MLAGVTDDFTIWITIAEEVHDSTTWGNAYITAMAAWALHRYQKALQGDNADGSLSAAGPIQSQRTGDVSVSWQASSGIAGADRWDFDYPSTPQGVLYLTLLRSRSLSHSRFMGGYVRR